MVSTAWAPGDHGHRHRGDGAQRAVDAAHLVDERVRPGEPGGRGVDDLTRAVPVRAGRAVRRRGGDRHRARHEQVVRIGVVGQHVDARGLAADRGGLVGLRDRHGLLLAGLLGHLEHGDEQVVVVRGVGRLDGDRRIAVLEERHQVVELVVGAGVGGRGVRVVDAVTHATHGDQGAVGTEAVVVVAGAAAHPLGVDVDGRGLAAAADVTVDALEAEAAAHREGGAEARTVDLERGREVEREAVALERSRRRARRWWSPAATGCCR